MDDFAMQTKTLDAATPASAGRVPQARLEDACKEFEGMLLAIILKDGMKPVWRDDEEPMAGSENFQDFAMEQTARALGQQGVFGIAETMMAQMAETKGL